MSRQQLAHVVGASAQHVTPRDYSAVCISATKCAYGAWKRCIWVPFNTKTNAQPRDVQQLHFVTHNPYAITGNYFSINYYSAKYPPSFLSPLAQQ